MPLTPEEKRKRDRERKARQRAGNRVAEHLAPITTIGASKRDEGGTRGGTQGGTSRPASVPPSEPAEPAEDSTEAAALVVLDGLEIPPTAVHLRPAIIRLARAIDEPANVPQLAQLVTKYDEKMSKLLELSKTKVADELDTMRRDFYSGRAQRASTTSRRKSSSA